MLKPLVCENLSKASVDKLQSNGFYYMQDVVSSQSPWVRDILKHEVYSSTPQCTPQLVSALDIWRSETESEVICSGCSSVDTLLGGGVPCGQVTELCGGPGSGKTQLCMQMCVRVQLPCQQGGLGPTTEALYIDTAANFTAHRLAEIATCYEDELHSDEEEGTWLQDVLKRVHVLEVSTTAKFCAAVITLEDFLHRNPKVRLVVIDTMSSPFKDDCSETERTGILHRTAVLLHRLALGRKIAVLVCNELNVRAGLEQAGGMAGAGLVGALGDSWAHQVQRLLLAPPLLALTHAAPNQHQRPIQIGKKGIKDA